MYTTTKELAKICHVSRRTVDRALHDLPGISSATKEQILKTAKQYNYRFDWKAGVHTPRLASVQFITAEKVVKPVFESGYGPQQYNKFPLKRRYLGACPEVLHHIASSLSRGRSLSIGVVLFDLQNPYFSRISNIISIDALRQGYFIGRPGSIPRGTSFHTAVAYYHFNIY